MPVPLPPATHLDVAIARWLDEDWGRGDRATASLYPIPTDAPTQTARVKLKQTGVIAGLPVVERIWQKIESLHPGATLTWTTTVEEGARCEAGTAIASITGSAALLLLGERVGLNVLAHLSGIATLTRTYADAIAAYPTQLVDTRKTRPGLRVLEKYAVAVGGGTNHRFGLDDTVMIKDNHILAAGSITTAIQAARARSPFPVAIEVETESLEQVREAIAYRADIIMLDNMSLELMSEAVKLIDGRAKIEASGNVTLQRLEAIARIGVDFISTSAPITQATWLDISLDFSAQTD
ncbi:MAG: carboxylating nicotinate-nucleotide diphosphorylase [Cyanobacteria bacterium J06639_1]